MCNSYSSDVNISLDVPANSPYDATGNVSLTADIDQENCSFGLTGSITLPDLTGVCDGIDATVSFAANPISYGSGTTGTLGLTLAPSSADPCNLDFGGSITLPDYFKTKFPNKTVGTQDLYICSGSGSQSTITVLILS